MQKVYLRKMPDTWRWWYLAYGERQFFKRFRHSGWICLHLGWMRRFWNGGSPKDAMPDMSSY